MNVHRNHLPKYRCHLDIANVIGRYISTGDVEGVLR